MGERITALFTMWRMRNCRAARSSASSLQTGEVAPRLLTSALCPLGAASGSTFRERDGSVSVAS